MSAQEASITAIQPQLFEVKLIKPSEGAVSLAHTREVPLPHPQTAELLKSENMGIGQSVGIIGGSGTISSVRLKNGRATWTVDVEDLEVEL